jgi:Uma2 family endonuclease
MSTDTASGTAPALLTAEEFARLPESGRPCELVRGKVVERSFHSPRHGQVCTEVACILGEYAEVRRLGHAVIGSGVITQRDPDTVRGPDVWFIGYDKVPPGPLPDTYLDLVPDLVCEIVSPSDRWSQVLTKTAEYLNAGVRVVCVFDPRDQTTTVHTAESHPVTLADDDELTFPDVLPGFSVPVRAFFE